MPCACEIRYVIRARCVVESSFEHLKRNVVYVWVYVCVCVCVNGGYPLSGGLEDDSEQNCLLEFSASWVAREGNGVADIFRRCHVADKALEAEAVARVRR